MFERLDQEARAAVEHAKDEAARAGKREVGTEHLLLGLLSRPGHASDALTAAGADAGDLRAQITPDDSGAASGAAAAAAPAAAPATGEELPLTSHARHALELALQATQRLRHRHISSGHLLLGVIEQQHNGAVQALSVAGIHVGTLRADVLQRLTSAADVDIT
ncbi:MAG TPA: Clp protease N-terminal domain-containing protein [Streptosporangiaceae bacterium]|nr:Clp protease N-terminal domain-containing protein [Streptosporangiaceae bacterium]